MIACGTRWRWVVKFTPELIYPMGNNSHYPLSKRLVRSHSLCRHTAEEKTLLPLPAKESRFPGCLARSLVTYWASDYSFWYRIIVVSNAKSCISIKPKLKCPVSTVIRQWTRQSSNRGSIASGVKIFFCSPKCRRPTLGYIQFAAR